MIGQTKTVLVLLGGWLLFRETMGLKEVAGGSLIPLGGDAACWDSKGTHASEYTVSVGRTACSHYMFKRVCSGGRV